MKTITVKLKLLPEEVYQICLSAGYSMHIDNLRNVPGEEASAQQQILDACWPFVEIAQREAIYHIWKMQAEDYAFRKDRTKLIDCVNAHIAELSKQPFA